MKRLTSSIRGRIAWAAATLVTLSALLTGCGSTPATRYYTLMPPPGADERAVTATRIEWELLPVVIPAQIDQPQWVVRKADGSLAVLEQERWIAPLGDEIRGAVAERLTRAFGPPLATGSAGKAPHWRIRIDVQRFDLIPGRETRLVADWSVRGDGVAISCVTSVTQQVAEPDYVRMAHAQQQAVSKLADAIGAALQAANKEQAFGC